MSIEEIIFYLLLIDSVGANLAVWFKYRGWYPNFLSKNFPLVKGWAGLYLALVLYIWYLTF